VRITIRVRPGAGRTSVGGGHDGALVVRVGARAADGRATEAALAAVADAFGPPGRRRPGHPLDFQRRVAAERLRLPVEEVPGGHLAALGHPVELVDALLATG
jgi:hypothetical protein